MHEYATAHWSELFPENPNHNLLCLKLGYHVLISPYNPSGLNLFCWDTMLSHMREPDELKQVISYLSTPTARASLVKYLPQLAPFVHDPLLIACYCEHWVVLNYILRTAPPDVQRFNEVVRAWGNAWRRNARLDMQVNGDGVVVAVDPDGGEGNRR